MLNVTGEIITALNTMFAPLDERVLSESIKWAKERVAALRAYETSPDSNRKDQHNFYSKAFAIAGGKTWYFIFHGRNEKMINEFMVKNCAATAAKRNATIARKLDKAGVTEVVSSDYQRSENGFDGTFKVKTNAGDKTVNVNTIYAGGYNIQCLHLRVLTKIF